MSGHSQLQSKIVKKKKKSSKKRKQQAVGDSSYGKHVVEELTERGEEVQEPEMEDHDASISSTNTNTDVWCFEEDVMKLLKCYKKYSDKQGRVSDKRVFYNILLESQPGFRNQSIDSKKVFDKLKKLKEWYYRERNGQKGGLNAQALARYDLLHAKLRIDPSLIPHKEFMEEFYRRKRLGFPMDGN